MRPLSILLVLNCLLCMGGALAQAPAAAPADAPMQTVQVTGTRTRLVPYADLFYPMARAVQDALGGRAALAVQVRGRRQEVRVDDLAVWLEGEHETIAVKLEPSGVFVVPVNERIALEHGHFLINKRKEDLSINLVLVARLGRDEWTMGAVRHLLADARGSIGKLLPWYQKPVVWAVTRKLGVAVCSRMHGAQVAVLDGEQTLATLPAGDELRDHAQQTVFCRRFDGSEAYPDSARLVIPEGAEVLLL